MYYSINVPKGTAVPNIEPVRIPPLPINHTATMAKFGRAANVGNSIGDPRLTLSGGSIDLDETYIPRIIFGGVETHLAGKPVIIEVVVFRNCKFDLEDTEPARKRGEKLPPSKKIDFSNDS
jgi:hypothetical protein